MTLPTKRFLLLAFTAKKLDAYVFVDAAGRAVALPSLPYLALRIRRLP